MASPNATQLLCVTAAAYSSAAAHFPLLLGRPLGACGFAGGAVSRQKEKTRLRRSTRKPLWSGRSILGIHTDSDRCATPQNPTDKQTYTHADREGIVALSAKRLSLSHTEAWRSGKN